MCSANGQRQRRVASLPGTGGGITAMGTHNAEIKFPLDTTVGLIWLFTRIPEVVKRACLNVAEQKDR